MTLQNPPAGYPVMGGVILTTLITAIIHLSFGIPLFVLNGLGYLGLLVLLYVPLPALARFQPAVRYVLIGYTVLTIVLYFVMAPLMAVGLLTKAVEVVLVVLLVMEAIRARRVPG